MQFLHIPAIKDLGTLSQQAIGKSKNTLHSLYSRRATSEQSERSQEDPKFGSEPIETKVLETHHKRHRIQPKVWLYQNCYIAMHKMEGLAGMVGNFGPPRVCFANDSPPIFLFGEKFRPPPIEDENSANREEPLETMETDTSTDFMRNFKALLWFTYRRNFVPMQPPSSYTSDTGWGCMLRSAQMILAQMLQRHLMGRSAWQHSNIDPAVKERKRQLLRWFVDAPKLGALYSIHRMTQCGVRYGKEPGEWYGPTTAALVLRDLVEAHRVRGESETYKSHTTDAIDSDSLQSPSGHKVAMVVSDDGTIYVNEVLKLCQVSNSHEAGEGVADPLSGTSTPLPEWHTAVFILLPLRLGLDKLNEDYLRPLIAALRIKECVGMIGGKPAHSLFFVGSQGDNLIYLDPHTVQPAALERSVRSRTNSSGKPDESEVVNEDSEEMEPNNTMGIQDINEVLPREYILPSDEDLATYCCDDPKVMPAKDIDPSLAIGFYCSSRAEFDSLCNRIAELKAIGLPILNTMLDRPNYAAFMSGDDDELDMDSDQVDLDNDLEDLSQFHDALSFEEQQDEKGEVNTPKSAQSYESTKSDEFVLL